MLNQFLLQLIALLVSCSEGNEGHDDLTFDFVRFADDSCLANLGMRDESGLDLSVGEPVSGYLQHIVDSALDGEVSILVLWWPYRRPGMCRV